MSTLPVAIPVKKSSLFVATTDCIYILSDRWGLVSPTHSIQQVQSLQPCANSLGVQCHIQRRHTQHSASSSSSDIFPFPSSAVFPNIEGMIDRQQSLQLCFSFELAYQVSGLADFPDAPTLPCISLPLLHSQIFGWFVCLFFKSAAL